MPHLDTIIETLRQRGHRITPQREMIAEILAHSHRHMTAEEIFKEAQTRTQTMNITTVYRTLDFLVEEGLVSRTDLRGTVIYSSVRHGSHIHLVCRCCGRVIEADDALITPLDEQLREEYGFAADLQHIAMFGLCAACQARSCTQTTGGDE